MSLLIMLIAPFANLNILSNVKAQEYNDIIIMMIIKYSPYPTEENKYECRTGPFEGFFVSSVEFCKFKFDRYIEKIIEIIEQELQGPPGIRSTRPSRYTRPTRCTRCQWNQWCEWHQWS